MGVGWEGVGGGSRTQIFDTAWPDAKNYDRDEARS